jgi:hypothetical protein
MSRRELVCLKEMPMFYYGAAFYHRCFIIVGLVSTLVLQLQVSGFCISAGKNYPTPIGSLGTLGVTFSFSGSYLAAVGIDSSSVTISSVGKEGTLSGSISYALPFGSSGPFSEHSLPMTHI